MSEPTPSQRRCIEDSFGVPAAVVAGAGSGKTDTLTRRIVYALLHPDESGCRDIDEILAITYTDKAAGELRSRIKAALDQAATAENGLALQALKADGAWIGTIHGMCSRILRENALTFGVDPAFGVLVDEGRALLLDRAVEQVLADCGSAALQRRIDGLLDEYSRSEVSAMLLSLLERAAAAGPGGEPFHVPPTLGLDQALMGLAAVTQELLARLEALEADSGKLLSAKAQDYRSRAEGALRELFALDAGADPALAAPSRERFAELGQLAPAQALALGDRFPKLPGSIKAAKEPLESCGLLPQAALARWAAELCLAAAAPYLDTLVQLVPLVQGAFGELKRQQGMLDNDDLLALCAQQLQDPANEAVRERYNRRFKLVMVDEFQDTNRMQVDMINLVAGGIPGQPSPKLCVVGDAQQSIYRFRNADLAVFKDHVAQVEALAGGMRIELGDNFRSHGEILAFSKGVFQDVFGEDYLDLLHGRDEQRITEAGAGYVGATGPQEPFEVPRRVNVAVFGTERNRGISERAARSIARDLRALADRGARPGDMAVLLGTMGHADLYARALEEEGLRCAITGGTVFRSSPEARTVGRLLFALANPRDTEALATVLTSDLFALEAGDLLRLASLRPQGAGRLWDAFARPRLARELLADEQDPPSPYLRNAVEVLGRALGRVGRDQADAIVEDVLVESGWLRRCQGGATAQAADALKAVRMVRDIQQDAPCGMLGLARRFQARLETAKEAPGVLSAKGDDFVRIMTIHASKGLSIPIVAVAEAEFDPRDHGRLKAVTVGDGCYLALRLQRSLESLGGSGLVATALRELAAKGPRPDSPERARQALAGDQGAAAFYGALRYLDLLGDAEEHQRKLYVAFTRAKEALLVTMRKAPKESKAAQVGVLDTGAAIAQLALGDPQAPEYVKACEAARLLIPLRTAYEQAPGHDIDWTLRLQVEPPSDPDGAEEAGEGAQAQEPTQAGAPFLIPHAPAGPLPEAVPYRALWSEGVLSASSLKAAAAEAEEAPAPVEGEAGVDVPFALDDDEPAAATERGTAFHALGEWAAAHRRDDGSLPMPPDGRIAAMARLYGLNGRQERELPQLLRRWLGSEPAQAMAALAHVVPEQPFWVELQGAQGARRPLVLQGFIDLLGYDVPGSGRAYAVDYKTGTHLADDAARRRAYGLQAACYAYALLLQGFDEAVLDFVFVDQPEADGAPSVTRFPGPGEPPYALGPLREFLLGAVFPS